MPSFSESQWRAIQERHAAEVDGLRTTLSQQQSRIAMLEADAEKWRAVPWETIDTVIYYGQHGYNFDDELSDLQQWYLMHAPQAVGE